MHENVQATVVAPTWFRDYFCQKMETATGYSLLT